MVERGWLKLGDRIDMNKLADSNEYLDAVFTAEVEQRRIEAAKGLNR